MIFFQTHLTGPLRDWWKRHGTARSPEWGTLEKAVKEEVGECECCGAKKRLAVHHKQPFHLFPWLELARENLKVMCWWCHFVFGHLKWWKSWNDKVDADCLIWKERFTNRPS